jgi:hypothetical protein
MAMIAPLVFARQRYGRPVPVHPLLGFDPNRVENNASFSSTLDPPVIEGGRVDAL